MSIKIKILYTLVISLVFISIIISSGTGGYFYFFKKATDPQSKVPDKIFTLSDGSTIDINKIKREVAGTKKVTEATTRDMVEDDIDPNKIYLMHQISTNPCKYNESYGLDHTNNHMWVNNDCRATFFYKNKIGYCGTYNNVKRYCPLDRAQLDFEKKISGFVERKINLVGSGNDKLKDCEGKYGFLGINDMYVTDHCDGRFQIGSLYGACTSSNGEKAVCPLGRTIKDQYNINQGLFVYPVWVTHEITPETCLKNEDEPDEVVNYGVTDQGNKFWVDKGCKGKFSLFMLSGHCKSDGGRVECPIGHTEKINGEKMGLKY